MSNSESTNVRQHQYLQPLKVINLDCIMVKNLINCWLIRIPISCFPHAISKRLAVASQSLGRTDLSNTTSSSALCHYCSIRACFARIVGCNGFSVGCTFQKIASSQQCSPGLCLKVKLTLFHPDPLPFPFLTISCCHRHLLCPLITNKLLPGISTSTTLPILLAFPALPLRTEPSDGSDSS